MGVGDGLNTSCSQEELQNCSTFCPRRGMVCSTATCGCILLSNNGQHSDSHSSEVVAATQDEAGQPLHATSTGVCDSCWHMGGCCDSLGACSACPGPKPIPHAAENSNLNTSSICDTCTRLGCHCTDGKCFSCRPPHQNVASATETLAQQIEDGQHLPKSSLL